MGADQAYGFSILVALDRGFDRNPARLAVAGANNPITHGVVAHRGGDSVAEFLLGGLAVLGMDGPYPVLVGLVARIEGQAVNQQILRRPAIAETGGQVGPKTADPADLLHAREFGLAFPQRDGRKILLGHIAAHHEHAANAVALVNRAVAVGPVDLLQLAVTRDRNQLGLVPRRHATAHHLLDLRTDNMPDFGPALPSALPE